MKRKSHRPVYVLASGGTGGHLFPALSLGKFLKDHNRKTYLFTDDRGSHFREALSCFDKIFIKSVKRRLPLIGKSMLYISLVWHTFVCFLQYLRLKPTVVIGFGGYPSFAPVFAAQLLGIPTVIHEQNVLLGRANRFLATRSYRIATSFESTQNSSKDRISFTGNPVRSEIADLKNCFYPCPSPSEPFHILIIGGSQGAKIFSDVIPKALVHLPLDFQRRLKITQQCRPEYLAQTKALYRQSFLDVNLQTFFEDVGTLYKEAHLVISRAGASTIAELAVTGRPSLLIPYAASLNGDQLHNAQAFSSLGAAQVFREKEFTPQSFTETLIYLMNNPHELENMARIARSLSCPEATKNLATVVAEIIGDTLLSPELKGKRDAA